MYQALAARTISQQALASGTVRLKMSRPDVRDVTNIRRDLIIAESTFPISEASGWDPQAVKRTFGKRVKSMFGFDPIKPHVD